MSIGHSQATRQRHRVQLLRREALRARLDTFKAKDEWLTAKVLACDGDEQALEDLRELLRVMPFPFKPASIDAIRRYKEKRQAFDTIDTVEKLIERVKERWPIRYYCEHVLGLTFDRYNSCKCPLQDGHTLTSFVIDEKTGQWFCFGNCPQDPGKNYRSGDVIDLHRIVKRLSHNKEAVKDLLSMPRTGQHHLIKTERRVGVEAVKAKSDKDEKLIATVLTEMKHVNEAYVLARSSRKRSAYAFAGIFLHILREDDLPVVFKVSFKVPVIGGAARRLLLRQPQTLEYLRCSTAHNEDDGNTTRNVKERLFLDVEWDGVPLEDQLRLIWWLKVRQRWRLISITFSGHESYHGLFAVRGLTKGQVEKMEALAIRLGVCQASLRPRQPVRFPAGYNKRWQTEQRILYLRS